MIVCRRSTMSIPLDQFADRCDLNAEESILLHLYFRDRGYRAEELATELDLARGTVDHALSDLKTHDLVRNKSPYWAITDEIKEDSLEFMKKQGVFEKVTPDGVSVDVEDRNVILQFEKELEGAEVKASTLRDFWD